MLSLQHFGVSRSVKHNDLHQIRPSTFLACSPLSFVEKCVAKSLRGLEQLPAAAECQSLQRQTYVRSPFSEQAIGQNWPTVDFGRYVALPSLPLRETSRARSAPVMPIILRTHVEVYRRDGDAFTKHCASVRFLATACLRDFYSTAKERNQPPNFLAARFGKCWVSGFCLCSKIVARAFARLSTWGDINGTGLIIGRKRAELVNIRPVPFMSRVYVPQDCISVPSSFLLIWSASSSSTARRA